MNCDLDIQRMMLKYISHPEQAAAELMTMSHEHLAVFTMQLMALSSEPELTFRFVFGNRNLLSAMHPTMPGVSNISTRAAKLLGNTSPQRLNATAVWPRGPLHPPPCDVSVLQPSGAMDGIFVVSQCANSSMFSREGMTPQFNDAWGE